MKLLLQKTKLTESGCLEYQGFTNPDGYGMICRKGKTYLTHRYVYAATAPIPEGLKVLHKCNNAKCVEISHLYLGTDLDNSRDCRKSGRHSNGNTRFTWEQVRELRRRVAAGESATKVGAEFGMLQPNACQIVNGKSWQE